MKSEAAGGTRSARPAGRGERLLARTMVERQFVPRSTFWWAWLGRSGRGGFLPPRRHRLLVMLLLAAAAYCLLLHQQQQDEQPPPHLALSSHGNRSRALTAFGDEASASHRVAARGEGANRAAQGFYSSGEESGGWESEVEEELGRRRERVWEVCKASGLVGEDGTSRGEPNAWEFFIDERHHLVWCNVFKAASSSWMYNFNLLGSTSATTLPTHDRGSKALKPRIVPWMKYFPLFAGYKEQYLRRSRKSPLSLARERFPRPTVRQLRTALPRSLSFLIVRDPFERLLSAYRNKIEGFRHKFYRKMAREMISRFRFKTSPAPGTHRSLNNEKSPTFSEFVSWVVESARRAKGSKDGGYSGVPGFDEHWAPYYRFCTPCAVNFTVIAKMETLSRDEDYIIQKSGIGPALGRVRQGSEAGARPREAVNAAIGGRTEDVLPRYFQTLSREQLDALYDIYRMDFQMFGYDPSKYYDMLPS